MAVRGRTIAVVAIGFCTCAATSCTSSQTSTTAPTADKCAVTVSSNPTSFDASGGRATLAITSPRDCSWAVSTSADWINVDASTRSGQGAASVPYVVAPNPTPTRRTGSIAVASDAVPVEQAGAPCRFGLSSTAQAVDAEGGRFSIAVTTLAGCTWTAESAATWIAVVSGGSGNSDGTVTFAVAANPGAARNGQVTIAGQTVQLQQAGAPAPPSAPAPSPAPTPPTPAPPSPAPTPAPPPAPSPHPAPSPPPTPPPAPQRVSFTGGIASIAGRCPSLSMNVDGRTVTTDGSTKFKHTKCDDLSAGTTVAIDGVITSNGSVAAAQVDKVGGHH